LVFPALKLLIGVDPLCTQQKTVVSVICNGYCSSAPVLFYKALVHAHDNSLEKLHRALFRTGNLHQRIPFIMEDFLKALPVLTYQNNPCISCKRIPLHWLCQSEIMAAFTLSNKHNVSFNVHQITTAIFQNFMVDHFHTNIESVSSAIYFSKFSLPISLIVASEFNKFSHSKSILRERYDWQQKQFQVKFWDLN